MKKIFIVFGMVLFIYTTMSIFFGEINPLLWISGSGEKVFGVSMVFAIGCIYFYMRFLCSMIFDR